MSSLLEMPHVTQCNATSCGYNHDGCHAFAVSIDTGANCATFLPTNDKGGLDVVAQVGACQRQVCVHNQDLECKAPAITVGGSLDKADCLSYEPR